MYGDFNRDGLKDAAVIVSEGEGGSGDFRAPAFLINDGRRLIHQTSHYLGDRVIIHSLRNRGGKVALDMFVHPLDPLNLEGQVPLRPTFCGKGAKRVFLDAERSVEIELVAA